MTVPQSFWRKKEVVSFCLSILVFMTHISTFFNYRNIGQISQFEESFWHFASNCITQFAVPLFFIISGALFFRDYSNETYVPKLKKRIRSLLIPFLIWNTIWMLFDLICTKTPISKFFLGRQAFEVTPKNIFEGIFHYGRNLPFWFIFALMCFVLIAPLIDLLLRNKYVGIFAIGTIWVLSFFEIGLPTPLFFKQNSIVYFLIGAYIGKHGFSLLLRPNRRQLQILCAFGIVAIAFALYFLPSNWPLPVQAAITDVLNLFAAGAFWCAADLFAVQLGKYRSVDASFAVFALHVNVSAVVTKLLFFVLPKTVGAGTVNFFLTIVITMIPIVVFYLLVCRFFPLLAAALFGKKATSAPLKEAFDHG